MRFLLLTLGSLLPLVAGLVYAVSIVRGEVRPQITTRLLLMVVTLVAFLSLLAGHDHSGMWLALTSFIESLIIWLLALRFGIGSLFNRLDIICLALCGVGVGLWIVSGQSLLGLLASIVADCIGCVPSLVKTWKLPYTETTAFYLFGMVAGLCILFATPITLVNMLFPAYIALIDGTFVVVIMLRRRFATL
jgi:hypothetical protein